MHSRLLKPGIVLIVLASFLSSMVGPLAGAFAAPSIAPAANQERRQDDEGTPPVIEPVDESTTQEEGAEGDLAIEIADDLGDGGQPDGLPREIALGDARYLYDRMVPLTPDSLAPVAANESLNVYATAETGPFEAIYVAGPDGDGGLARYLPERIGEADVACPVDAADIGQLDAGDAIYAFAGFETDLTPDTLQEVGTSGPNTVYAEPGAGQPLPEVFVADASGLIRFVLAGDDGRPESLAESLAFGGAQFAFTAEVTGEVDPGSLTRVGCAGPYPVLADPEPGADRYVFIGGRLYQFTGDPEAVATPPEAPTEQPTEAPTEAPTEVPTEVPTEAPTEAPTEIPTEAPTEVPTEAPTEIPTEAPTEAPTEEPTEVPADMPTEVPAEEPTEAPTEPATEAPAGEATEAPAGEEAAQATVAATTAPVADDDPAATPDAEETATATDPPETTQSAEAAGLPVQVDVQNTTYVFNQVNVDIDIQTLVEIDVITVNNIELTVYAEQEFQGVAPQIYCVADDGEVIGRYVPVAATNPTPPAELPATIDVENTTYVFNQVNVDIDVQTLVEVNVIVVQNVELTIYADQDVDGQPTRYYAVTADGQVTGQYVAASLAVSVAPPTPQPTVQLQPPAVVPTQAPDAPPPAAVTAEPSTTCAGSPGPINDQGIPAYLPNRIQVGGIAYALAGPQDPAEAGELTRIGCIGAFEVLTTDAADRSEVLYLRIASQGAAADLVYRFDVAVTFNVQFEVTGRPSRISAAEQQYRLIDTWLPSIYSSTTVILFVDDVENTAPDVFYAVNVYNTVVGEVVGEYRLAEPNTAPAEDIVAAAEAAGINADLTVEGQLYLLANVYRPVGTTTNGFVTLFAATGEGEAEFLLGRDKRRLELFIYDVIPAQETGG